MDKGKTCFFTGHRSVPAAMLPALSVRTLQTSVICRPGMRTGGWERITQSFPISTIPALGAQRALPRPRRTTKPSRHMLSRSTAARSTYPSCRLRHTTGKPVILFRLVSTSSLPFSSTHGYPARFKRFGCKQCIPATEMQHSFFCQFLLTIYV